MGVNIGALAADPMWVDTGSEHAIIDIEQPSLPIGLGDQIEIWVHYSDATVNLHDRMYGIRNGTLEEIFRIEG